MPNEPLWLTFDEVLEIHDEQIALRSGLAGIRDRNTAEASVLGCRNLYHYMGQDDVLTLAVYLCRSIAKGHAYLDGNKRTAAFAMIEFLAINGYNLIPPDDDANAGAPWLGVRVEAIAGGTLSDEDFYDELVPYIY